MRILVDHGERQHRNRGDAAMLDAAVQGLHGQWPDAEIDVLTGDADALCRNVPAANPLVDLPPRRFRRRRTVDVGDYDLVVGGGGGYLTDVDPEQTRRIMRLLIEAADNGVATALFSQGIGPLADDELRDLVARGCGPALVVGLREGVTGPRILAELGVTGDRVVVTGDDAVIVTGNDLPDDIGGGIGVNHRVASYLQTEAGHADLIRGAVQAAAVSHGAPLIPIPISEWDDDRPGTELLTRGCNLVEQPGHAQEPYRWAVRRTDRTRIIATSTYHLAVFALSRGVPAVCIAASEYYRYKFTGLREHFGDGCRIVPLNGPDPGSRLVGALEELWDAAPALRDPLRLAGLRQRRACLDLYGTLQARYGARSAPVASGG